MQRGPHDVETTVAPKVLASTERSRDTLLVIAGATALMAPVELRNLHEAIGERLSQIEDGESPQTAGQDTEAASGVLVDCGEEPALPAWTEAPLAAESWDDAGSVLPADSALLSDSVASLRGAIFDLGQRVGQIEVLLGEGSAS